MRGSVTYSKTGLMIIKWILLLGCLPACKQSVEQVNCLPQIQSTPARIRSFQAAAHLESYLNCEANNLNSVDSGLTDKPTVSTSNSAENNSNTNITNNQEEGVDEGGIVKNIGDYLITLRRGRLFSAYIGEVGRPLLKDAVSVPEVPTLSDNVWYDELLVKEDKIFVLGFRYFVPSDDVLLGTVEIHTFQLRSGKIERLKTVYIESNDYYSFSNYASRLARGKLVFYMPFSAVFFNGTRYVPGVPHYLNFQNGKFYRSRPVVESERVYLGLESIKNPVLHTLLICDLDQSGDFNCKGESVLGDRFRETYISTSHAFLWGQNTLYALDLETRTLKAHRIEGAPIDQFSFKQIGTILHVISQKYETGKNTIQLSSLPLAAFNLEGNQDVSRTASSVDVGLEKIFYLNRFVENAFVLGGYTFEKSFLLILPLGATQIQEIELDAAVVRVEALPGLGFLALTQSYGSRGVYQLSLHTVLLGEQPKIASSVSIPAFSAEWRSHGFFFKPSLNGGVLGVPVVNPSEGSYWWGTGAANIAYFSLSSTGDIVHIGSATSNSVKRQSCQISCIDWYGNTRPIFLGERGFALLGDELQEVNLIPGAFDHLGIPLVLE